MRSALYILPLLECSAATAQQDLLVAFLFKPRSAGFTNTWSAASWTCGRDIPRTPGAYTSWVQRISGGPSIRQTTSGFQMISEDMGGYSSWRLYGTNYFTISPSISCVATMASLSVVTRPATNSLLVTFGGESSVTYFPQFSSQSNRIYIRTDGTQRYISANNIPLVSRMMIFAYRDPTNAWFLVNNQQFGTTVTQDVPSLYFDSIGRLGSTFSVGYDDDNILFTNRPFTLESARALCSEYNTNMPAKVW